MRVLLNDVSVPSLDLIESDLVSWNYAENEAVLGLVDGSYYTIAVSEENFLAKQKEGLVSGYMDISNWEAMWHYKGEEIED